MAEAFKCDRCQEYNDGSPIMSVHAADSKSGTTLRDDLCQLCRNSYTLWRVALKDKREYSDRRGTLLDAPRD